METERTKQLKADLALLGVTFIWGVTFVVVQNALADIGPYYFIGIRFMLAFLFLALIYWKYLPHINRATIAAGIIIGLALFGGYAFQTVGLQYTGAANAGFITGLSVVLVPIFTAITSRKMPGPIAAIGVLCSAVGLALLSLGVNFRLNYGDILVFFCAVCFAMHIILVSKYASHLNSVLLATIQIGTVSILSFLFGLGLETMPSQFTRPVWIAFLITAIPATSLALLMQNWAQKFTSATHTAVIFTMEPVFAAITAYFWANEILSSRQLIGCSLILIGMLMTELKGSSGDIEKSRPDKQGLA